MNKRAFTPIVVNGQQKIMRFDLNAIADLEEYYGKGISQVFTEENIGLSTIRAFYWAGLKWQDRGMTVEQAGEIIQQMLDEGKDLNEILEPIMNGLKASGLLGSQKEVASDEANEVDEKN